MSETVLKKQWLQMGAELEGSWVSKSRKSTAEGVRGAKPQKDPSVHIGVGDPGEIVTRPHDNLEGLSADIIALYPDTVHDTCGFHIHTSFTPLQGSIIATREFYAYFKSEWAKWGKEMKFPRNHEFWNRLEGRNKFCKDLFEPEEQFKPVHTRPGGGAPTDNSVRYTMVNFHAWEKHGTIECRLLPQFSDREIAVKALYKLAYIYDSYLGEHGFAPINLESPSTLSGGLAIETYEVRQPSVVPTSYTAEGYFPSVVAGDDVFYAISGAEGQMHPFKKDTGTVTP